MPYFQRRATERAPATNSALRRLVHSTDAWSRPKGVSFVVVLWLGFIGSLIWFLGSAVTNADTVYFALVSLIFFGAVALVALVYDMVLVPYIHNTDRGMSERRAMVQLLVTVAEIVLSVGLGSVGKSSGASSALGSGMNSGGGSFGGGGASGSW